ncbi:MAG: M55 family metallopeptidase [Candidatus Cloacimonas sp.]|jgi:D-amino peptidase|nr:M55 family metallopeptidase [Candidatus Cloacimonas sp.]
MKIYISIDMEGMPGTFNWDQEKTDRAAVRRNMQAHVQDAINAILNSKQNNDIDEIVIADSHSAGDNLDFSICALDPRISLISGGPRPAYMMPGFSNAYSQVFLLGYHAGTGAMQANMDHTYSNSRIHKIWINEIRMNEALINAAYAGYQGVPVALISGDKALQAEMLPVMPWLEFVCTKEAVAKFAAKNYSPLLVQQQLEQAVQSSLGKAKIQLYTFTQPITLKIEFHSTAMTDVACLMPYTKRLDGRTVEFSDSDYGVIFEAIMALVTLASTAGM